jgi:hypothetical protein
LLAARGVISEENQQQRCENEFILSFHNSFRTNLRREWPVYEEQKLAGVYVTGLRRADVRDES